MQHEVLVADVRVLVDVVDALGIEQRGAALDAVHLVTLLEQEFRKVRTILASHAGNQSFLHHVSLNEAKRARTDCTRTSARSGELASQ